MGFWVVRWAGKLGATGKRVLTEGKHEHRPLGLQGSKVGWKEAVEWGGTSKARHRRERTVDGENGGRKRLFAGPGSRPQAPGPIGTSGRATLDQGRRVRALHHRARRQQPQHGGCGLVWAGRYRQHWRGGGRGNTAPGPDDCKNEVLAEHVLYIDWGRERGWPRCRGEGDTPRRLRRGVASLNRPCVGQHTVPEGTTVLQSLFVRTILIFGNGRIELLLWHIYCTIVQHTHEHRDTRMYNQLSVPSRVYLVLNWIVTFFITVSCVLCVLWAGHGTLQESNCRLLQPARAAAKRDKKNITELYDL